MAAIQTVLFDLDGTLIDSIRLILDSYHHTLAAHGVPPRTDEDWLRGVGTPLSVQFAEWRDDLGKVEAMVATYRAYNLAHHDRMVTVYPGVVWPSRPSAPRAAEPASLPAKTGRGPCAALRSSSSRR